MQNNQESTLIETIFKQYNNLGGKANLLKFTSYFEKFSEMNGEAIIGEMDLTQSKWHKEVYDEAVTTNQRYLEITMKHYAKWIGNANEARRIFNAINSIIPCS